MTKHEIVNEIIKLFGGLKKMSEKLNHNHPTTVQGWKISGNIPKWRKYEVENAALEYGIELPKEFHEIY